jgi:replicative DNA helicase
MQQFKPTQGLRIPPQNLEAEMALLGSIMLRPESIYDIMDMISPQSFYSEKHSIIFSTMFEIWNKREPIDILSVSSRLKEKNLLDNIGGSSYLAEN